nr:hypothetical protein [Sphaerisporangium fuscum]
MPTGQIRYDNLEAAVARVLGFSPVRVETARWTAFRSHYGIEPFDCQPGKQGAHEKGGVEGDIGWFHRNHLVPIPEVASLAELNMMIDAWDRADEERRIGSRDPHRRRVLRRRGAAARTTARRAFRDRPAAVAAGGPPQPDHRARQPLLRACPPDRPTRPGHAARLRAHRLRRPRRGRPARAAAGQAASRLELDHYLEVLIRKPGALP